MLRAGAPFLVDLALVAVFVLVGRSSHDEDPLAGFLTTFWPFAVGLVVGWCVSRAWRTPLAAGRTGLLLWLSTVVVGMLLRVASGQGVAASFVLVAAIVLAVFIIGWRLLWRALRFWRSAYRRRTARGTPPATSA